MTEHAALDLDPARQRLDDHQRVVGKRLARARSRAAAARAHLHDADRRAQMCRLDEHRQSQRRRSRRAPARALRASVARARRRSSTWSTPATPISCLNSTLSMHTADAVTPAPTYATSSVSSSPCTVPSSPNGPCSAANTTSTPSSPSPGRHSQTAPFVAPGAVALDLHPQHLVSGRLQTLAHRAPGGQRHLVLGRTSPGEHRHSQRRFGSLARSRGRCGGGCRGGWRGRRRWRRR